MLPNGPDMQGLPRLADQLVQPLRLPLALAPATLSQHLKFTTCVSIPLPLSAPQPLPGEFPRGLPPCAHCLAQVPPRMPVKTVLVVLGHKELSQGACLLLARG